LSEELELEVLTPEQHAACATPIWWYVPVVISTVKVYVPLSPEPHMDWLPRAPDQSPDCVHVFPEHVPWQLDPVSYGADFRMLLEEFWKPTESSCCPAAAVSCMRLESNSSVRAMVVIAHKAFFTFRHHLF